MPSAVEEGVRAIGEPDTVRDTRGVVIVEVRECKKTTRLGGVRPASSRTRHFECATVLIKYAVLQLIVAVYLIGTKFMCADIFTKATNELTLKTMRALIRNSKEPAETYALRAARWINNANLI